MRFERELATLQAFVLVNVKFKWILSARSGGEYAHGCARGKVSSHR
jgi:hypothetical protein